MVIRCWLRLTFTPAFYSSLLITNTLHALWSAIIVHGESPVLLSVLLASLYIKVGALAVYKLSVTCHGYTMVRVDRQ